jgi:hypothetical protein
LATITSSKTYNLSCTWPGKTSLNVSWTAPLKNTDGSTLTDLAGFKVYYGTSSTMSNNTVKDVPGAGSTSVALTGLSAGTYYVVASAYNAAGTESDKTAIVSATLPASASVTRTVGIVVNPVPMAPTGLTVE